jgi:hypothetical protein
MTWMMWLGLALAETGPINVHGQLSDAAGAPAAGTRAVSFALDGAGHWEAELQVAFDGGAFSADLPDVPFDLFAAGDVALTITLDGIPSAPVPIAWAPRAAWASAAGNLAPGAALDVASLAVDGAEVIDASGRLTGAAAYQAGDGLELDPVSNSFSLSSACAEGEVLVYGSSGWICGASGPAANTVVQIQSTTPGSAQTGHANLSGTFIAGQFSGSGAGLTSLPGGQLVAASVPISALSSGTGNAGKILTAAASGAPTWGTVDFAAIESRLAALEGSPPATSLAPVTFSAAGTTNWTVPAGVYRVRVELWGGGGSGGASFDSSTTGYAAGGGGGGGYSQAILTVKPGDVIPVTVGAGAPTAPNASPGTAGGDTRFGNLLVARGGRGGGRGPTANAGNAGGPGGAGFTANGMTGSNAVGTTNVGGNGGQAGGPGGGDGGGAGSGSASGSPGAAPGGGGGGAAWTGPTTGGAGAVGRAIVDPIPSPTPAELSPVTFATPGSFDWIVPSGVTSVTVHLWGGGGGGGGSLDGTWAGYAAGGGGGGGYTTATVTVTPGATLPIVVGAGGTGGLPGSGGQPGGTTWFNGTLSAGGGAGANPGSMTYPNPGGAAGLGVTANGVGGNASHSSGVDVGGQGGKAGGTSGGLGGTPGQGNSGAPGLSPGGGGGGAAWAGTSEGGQGGDGLVRIVY